MVRASLTIAGLFAIGCLSVFGYSCATRTDAVPAQADVKTVTAAPAERVTQPSNAPTPAPSSEARTPQVSQTIASETVARWIAAVTGDDPHARAAAIVALGTAPKSEAVPVLKKILNSGSPEDRQLAVRSLRTLAAREGDADGGIRGALRQAIYHGDDETLAASAQAVLDEIEGDG